MKSNTALLPLIVRKEDFGGILFDPADATFLELDHEALDLVSAFLKNTGLTLNKKEMEFIKTIKKNITYDRKRDVKYITTGAGFSRDYDFTVFSAPTLADFQITNRCFLNCSHCYASSSPDGKHASMDDIDLVLSGISEYGVCQIAIGGGEPLLHPHIEEVLRLCHEKGIVPNLSTNGMHLTEKMLLILKKYCGAIAISLENTGEKLAMWRRVGFDHVKETILKLKSFSIPTVVQVTLSADNVHDLDDIVAFCLDSPHLYGVIFLAFKPAGRGKGFSSPLSTLDAIQVSKGLEAAFHKLSDKIRVGYDCCLAPAIAGYKGKSFVSKKYLEGCSACRSSIGISPDLDVIPCTFLPDYVLGNLKQNSLKEIWNGEPAGKFRDLLKQNSEKKERCSTCNLKNSCLGGCPVMDLVDCCYR
ncbi:MAG: radical SAM protein [Spirochaetales bacterium]|nr:radical SAM protein [Spirochaetales bacterium]